MDAIDKKILECLKENSRENASIIGAKVNMSVSAVIERIKKLENAGIIKKYTLVLDKEKLGLDMTAFVFVETEHPKFNDGFLEFVESNPQIVECHYMTGDCDYIIKVYTKGAKGLQSLINEINSVPGVSHTKSFVVLSTSKENCGPEINI